MNTSARLRAAASILVITIAAACGSDSTGPSESPSSVAAHFDSLYVEAHDLGDSINVYGGRALLLTLFAAHTVLLIQYDGAGTSAGGVLITNDTLVANVTDGSGATSLTSTSTACGTPSALLVNPQIPAFAFSTCNLAKFLTSFSLTSQTSASIDPALASLSISSATINGIRLLDVADAATLRRVRAVLHAARTGNRP